MDLICVAAPIWNEIAWPAESWDDLEALQQVTLGDMMEEQLQASFARRG